MAFVPMIADVALMHLYYAITVALIADPRTNGYAWIVKRTVRKERINVFENLNRR
jgi:hypothetical protein